jgi:hypothetical protein
MVNRVAPAVHIRGFYDGGRMSYFWFACFIIAVAFALNWHSEAMILEMELDMAKKQVDEIIRASGD